LNSLLQLRDELRRRDCFPIKLVADASLPTTSTSRRNYWQWRGAAKWKSCPAA
jgi:hypothetical protein